MEMMIQVSGADLTFIFSMFCVVRLASSASSKGGLDDVRHLFSKSDREHSSKNPKGNPPHKLNEVDNPGKEYRCHYISLCFGSELWKMDLLPDVLNCASQMYNQRNREGSFSIHRKYLFKSLYDDLVQRIKGTNDYYISVSTYREDMDTSLYFYRSDMRQIRIPILENDHITKHGNLLT